MRYTNISDLYKQVQERKLTPQELEDREKIAKKLPMDDFKKRYGKDAMAVKMAVATNIAKGKSEEVDLDENYRVLATKGMGTESSKMAKLGQEVDYY